LILTIERLGAEGIVYLGVRLRNRKKPRRRTGRVCVRERFEAVDTPLKRMKKSRNARKRPFLLSALMERTSLTALGRTLPLN
jgi:hypothetical protein